VFSRDVLLDVLAKADATDFAARSFRPPSARTA